MLKDNKFRLRKNIKKTQKPTLFLPLQETNSEFTEPPGVYFNSHFSASAYYSISAHNFHIQHPIMCRGDKVMYTNTTTAHLFWSFIFFMLVINKALFLQISAARSVPMKKVRLSLWFIGEFQCSLHFLLLSSFE